MTKKKLKRCHWCDEPVVPGLPDGIVPDFCAACLIEFNAWNEIRAALRRQLEGADEEEN